MGSAGDPEGATRPHLTPERLWYRGRVIPVGQFLPEALAAVLRKAPLTPEKVAFAWRQAVGPAVDRVSQVSWADGTLTVRVRDVAWLAEIDRARPSIQPRLERLLGAGAVRRIDVTTTGRVPDRPSPSPSPEA